MATNEPSAYSWNTASKVPRASRLASEYKYRVQPKVRGCRVKKNMKVNRMQLRCCDREKMEG